jgi:hypothetical protein
MRTGYQRSLMTHRLLGLITFFFIGVLLLMSTIDLAQAQAVPPPTPEQLTIAVHSNRIAVEWQITNESSIIFYTLHRSETDAYSDAVVVPALELSSISERDPAVTHYSLIDTTAQPGRSYHYWLMATDQQGASATFGPLTASLVDDASEHQHHLFLPVVTTR